MGSGKFNLKMCSKSGKLSAEIGICGKLNLKMLPVNDRLCGWTNWIAYPSQLSQIIIFSVDETWRVENP